MIKKLAWNTFKNTGDINSYLEFSKIEDVEEKIKENILNNEKEDKINLGENIGIDTNK